MPHRGERGPLHFVPGGCAQNAEKRVRRGDGTLIGWRPAARTALGKFASPYPKRPICGVTSQAGDLAHWCPPHHWAVSGFFVIPQFEIGLSGRLGMVESGPAWAGPRP